MDTINLILKHLKAFRRLPKWASNSHGHAHKLIKAFLIVSEGQACAQKATMHVVCSDPTHPETYIANFDKWYSDLKQESGNASGKFFVESEDGMVTVWEPVRGAFEQLKGQFLG